MRRESPEGRQAAVKPHCEAGRLDSSFSPPDCRHQLTMTKVIYSLLMAGDNSVMCSLIASGALPLLPAGQQTGTNHLVEGKACKPSPVSSSEVSFNSPAF